MDSSPQPIPLFEIDWDDTDIENVTESITRGGYWANGPYIDKFESELKSYFGTENAVVVNSGTTALVAILHALGIGDGDEVAVPSFTFISTANAVRLVDAEPTFVDIERETYGMSPRSLESRIGENIAAIVPVHCYGAGCQIEEIVSIGEEYDIPVVEDAAEAMGAELNETMLGTFGEAAILSFCQNKIIATGEGGAILTDDDELAKKVKLYRSHGRASSDYFDSADSGQYIEVGTNIRMSDLSAALGCSQLGRIDELINGRLRAATELNEGFAEIEGVQPHEAVDDGTHVYQLYTVELADWVDRTRVIETLSARNIASKIYWDPPIHRTDYYLRTKDDTPNLPVTDEISSRVLSLPMHPNLSTDETNRIIDAVESGIE